MKDFREIVQECDSVFPDVTKIEESYGDLICIGADLEIPTLLTAYSNGLFPMHIHDENYSEVLGWFSPVSRCVFDLGELRVTRSMKQSAKKYECRTDSCFDDLMRMCMEVKRPHGWIDESFIQAYNQLHKAGFAHSVEIFFEDELIGGLYGVGFGGFFAGESMVHTRKDASKVALMHLVEILKANGSILLDAQWMTPHLYSLGAHSVNRAHYIHLLEESLKVPSRSWS